MYGAPDTGKSAAVMALRSIVGTRNTCQISVEKMSDARAVAPIVGKLVNIITELDDNALIADGGFKQLVSTQEAIQVDPKNVKPFLYIPTCKHVIATNGLPSINDKTAATHNRLLVIPFARVFRPDEQDRELEHKISENIAGVLAWAVEGARRLIENRGQFTIPAESKRIVDEHREEQNPVIDFIDEFMVKIADEHTPSDEFRRKFSDWFGKPMNPIVLGKLLASIGHRPVKAWVRGADGVRAKRKIVPGIVFRSLANSASQTSEDEL
jgi:putative DNA primase/helicase